MTLGPNPLRAPYTVTEQANEIGHRFYCRRRRLGVGSETGAHRLDQSRADHDAIGALRDGARLLCRAHAEADADRQLGVPLDARDRGLDLAASGAAAPVMPVIDT